MARGFLAQPALLGLQRCERAIGLGDGLLGGAKGVARLATLRLLFLQLAGEPLDALAQRLQVGLLRCVRRARRKDEQARQRDGTKPRVAAQARAFPCVATEAVRRATSSASPR
jgi:hypothetical protein